MIDIEKERLKLMTEAAKSLPGRPHVSTLWRWFRRGIKGVKLETTVLGGRRYTSVEALQRFADRLTIDSPYFPTPPVTDPKSIDQVAAKKTTEAQSNKRRREEILRIEQQLDAEGF